LLYGVARKAGLIDAEAQEVVQVTVIAVAKKMKSGGFKFKATSRTFTKHNRLRSTDRLTPLARDLSAKVRLKRIWRFRSVARCIRHST